MQCGNLKEEGRCESEANVYNACVVQRVQNLNVLLCPQRHVPVVARKQRLKSAVFCSGMGRRRARSTACGTVVALAGAAAYARRVRVAAALDGVWAVPTAINL